MSREDYIVHIFFTGHFHSFIFLWWYQGLNPGPDAWSKCPSPHDLPALVTGCCLTKAVGIS